MTVRPSGLVTPAMIPLLLMSMSFRAVPTIGLSSAMVNSKASIWPSKSECMLESDVGGEYRKVAEQFDELLAKHGYRRDGGIYRAERPNHDTIALFCHFGVGSVLLSHLWNVSPMVVWHGFCAQTSSVTTVVTEERRKGIASFRMLAFGDTSHLYVHDEEPSFAARFCECYDDDTIHDY